MAIKGLPTLPMINTHRIAALPHCRIAAFAALNGISGGGGYGFIGNSVTDCGHHAGGGG